MRFILRSRCAKHTSSSSLISPSTTVSLSRTSFAVWSVVISSELLIENPLVLLEQLFGLWTRDCQFAFTSNSKNGCD